MKNHTYWVILRVLHSVPLRFTLISPKTNHSLVTGLYIADLVERGRHLERVRPSAPLYAHTKSNFQTSTRTKFRSHSFNIVVKGTGSHYRKWIWSGAPMRACTVDVDLVQTISHNKPYPHPHPVLIDFIKNTVISTQYCRRHFPLKYSCHDTGAAGQGGQNAIRVHLHPGPASDSALDTALR